MSCLRLCEVDDGADGDFEAADDANSDFDADQADDVVDDVADDHRGADGDTRMITINGNVSNCVINISSFIISNILTTIISSISSTIRMIVNGWQNVAKQCQEARSTAGKQLNWKQ